MLGRYNVVTGASTHAIPQAPGMPVVPVTIMGGAVASSGDMAGTIPPPNVQPSAQEIHTIVPIDIGTWDRKYDRDGGKFWMNSVTGQTSRVDPYM